MRQKNMTIMGSHGKQAMGNSMMKGGKSTQSRNVGGHSDPMTRIIEKNAQVIRGGKLCA